MEKLLNASRKSVLFLTLLGVLLGSPHLSTAAQGSYGYHGATQELVWRGTQALLLCNGLFVSNRTLDQIYAQEFVYPQPDGPDVPMPPDRVEINRDLKTVAIGVNDSKDLIPTMRAAYREGIGCVVMGVDQTFADIDKLPKLEMAPLPGDPATIPWPDGDLVEKKPLAEGVNPAALNAAGDWTFDRAGHGGHKGQVTLSLLVVHHGNIIYERYAPGMNMHTRMRTWSTAKSISATLTGIAVDRGLLDLNGPLPFTWPPDPQKGVPDPRQRIKLRDVLHMSSGLYPVDIYSGKNVIGSWLSYFSGWDSGYEARNRGLIREPGSFFVYENYDTLLGVYALRTVLANDKTYKEFPRRELFDKIGMRSTLPGMDRFGNYVLSSQVYTNSRDLARVGLMYLNEGMWHKERILPKEWVEWVRRPAYSTRNIGNTSTAGSFGWCRMPGRTFPRTLTRPTGRRGSIASLFPLTI